MLIWPPHAGQRSGSTSRSERAGWPSGHERSWRASGLSIGGRLWSWAQQLGSGYLGLETAEVDYPGPESGIRGEHPMVAVRSRR